MKKFSAFFIIIILTVSLCSCNATTDKQNKKNISNTDSETVRAVWINYNEISIKSSSDKTEKFFRDKLNLIFKNISDNGFNRVFFQVRAFSDAFYNSEYFPATAYMSGRQGVGVGYDALQIAVELAHSYNLKIDAWLNPYRVSYDNDITKLSDKNPAKLWCSDNRYTRNVIILDKGIFYNPTVPEVKKLVLNGVREILDNYAVDGIHIDDYFYPTTDTNFDLAEYQNYLENGGILTQSDWRRENVNSLVSEIYNAVKNKDESLIFSISPAGNIENNYNKLYADVALWSSQEGFCDMIVPQVYFGFENSSKPFKDTVNEWIKINTNQNIKLCFGLAFYKYGRVDEYAGDGREEWQKNKDIISRQVEYLRSLNHECNFSLYSYSSVFGEKYEEIGKKELKKINA